jgi:intein/homing endonuclease
MVEMVLKLEYMKDILVEKYESGMSVYQIAKEIGENQQAVSNTLKKYTTLREKVTYDIDESYFSVIDTEDKAYFLGFIAADGAIVNNGNNVMVLTISINKKDVGILEEMIRCMNSNHCIQTLQKDQVRFSVARKQIIEDLIKLGLTERKSLTLKPMIHIIPDNLKHHFIRGYFDGDGSIFWTKTGSKEKRRYVAIRGTKDFLEEIQTYFGVKGTIQFNTGTHQLRIGAKSDVDHIFQVMYEDSHVYLRRKYEKFIQ